MVVAKDLNRALGNTELIPVARALSGNSEQPFEAVGVIYPVYMFGLPLIIREFLNKISLKPTTYIFSVATLGGLVGRAHTLTRSILKRRDLDLAAGFSVLMPGNYIPLYGALPQEKQDEIFKQEKERIRSIAKSINTRQRGIIEEKPFVANYLLYRIFYRGGMSLVPSSGKNFWTTESCTKCGLCVKVCPVGNIELVRGSLRWLNHCQHCMACLQWCPPEAIQYKKNTLGRKRYRHPEVDVMDIINKRCAVMLLEL